jgi:hypothetical protein
MPVLVVAVTRSQLVVTSVVASPFQMRVDDQFLAIVDNWWRHQPGDQEMSRVDAWSPSHTSWPTQSRTPPAETRALALIVQRDGAF